MKKKLCTPYYEFNLELYDGFIQTKTSSQRNWMVQKLIDEFSSDINNLDELAHNLVDGSTRREIGTTLNSSSAVYSDQELTIDHQQVMQSWESPLMERMAKIVTENCGDVLEIGFGMGISASYIQKYGCKSHTIIECNEDVINKADKWKKNYNNKITIVNGKWQDVIHDLGLFDGILFDTYPLNEDEFNQYMLEDITFASHFFKTASSHLKDSGIFTYYSNEINSLSRRHQRELFKYFNDIRVEIVDNLNPPNNCNYWWHKSMVAVKAVK